MAIGAMGGFLACAAMLGMVYAFRNHGLRVKQDEFGAGSRPSFTGKSR